MRKRAVHQRRMVLQLQMLNIEPICPNQVNPQAMPHWTTPFANGGRPIHPKMRDFRKYFGNRRVDWSRVCLRGRTILCRTILCSHNNRRRQLTGVRVRTRRLGKSMDPRDQSRRGTVIGRGMDEHLISEVISSLPAQVRIAHLAAARVIFRWNPTMPPPLSMVWKEICASKWNSTFCHLHWSGQICSLMSREEAFKFPFCPPSEFDCMLAKVAHRAQYNVIEVSVFTHLIHKLWNGIGDGKAEGKF
mmetsp:Transcript_9627/g.35689  ORF Transcript_9627/g.35689 Transcript_9627/m.35689 type:complete len:246 (-) Transcript_9627:2685-3422(-)